MRDAHDSTDGTGRLTTNRRRFLAATGAVGVAGLGFGATTAFGQSAEPRSMTVRLENVSTGDTLETTAEGEASAQPVPLSPVVYAVHTRDEPIFSAGEPERNNGLEEVAEDGSPARLVESLQARETVLSAGAAAVPVGAEGAGPLLPGNAYEFTVEASPGKPTAYLSLVTMFVPSNDLFYSLGGAGGMALFRETGNAPMAGDVTDSVGLWDAGTEVNEEPGVGENQVQRQRGAGVGLVERGTVAPIEAVNGYDYPAVDEVLRLRITPGGGMNGNGNGNGN